MAKSLILYLMVILPLQACDQQKNVETTIVYKEVNRAVYVGHLKPQNYAQFMQQKESDINSVMQQKSIDLSESENELRIHFSSSLGDRYFKLQSVSELEQKVELVKMNYNKINDSLFLKMDAKIVWNEKRNDLNFNV